MDPRYQPSLIVQTSDRPKVDKDVPEISSLRGKISVEEMGSRAFYGGPETKSAPIIKPQPTSQFLQAEGVYHPATEATASAYRRFLDIITTILGDLPSETLYAAAEESLSILKSSAISDRERRDSTSELLGPISDQDYRTLSELSLLLTDFTPTTFPGETADEDIAYSIDEEEEEDMEGEVMEEVVLDEVETETGDVSGDVTTKSVSSLTHTFRFTPIKPIIPTDVDLPQGSSRFPHQDYEEIHIPARETPSLKPGERLIELSDGSVFPQWMVPAFKGMKTLNIVQSKVKNTALNTRDNILLCAPTGAGKTNVAVLTILSELSRIRELNENRFNYSQVKVVYVAPMKSLVAEMVNSFTVRFADFGLSVSELTGDVTMSRQQIQKTNIIVTTPEKWDVITRKSGEALFASNYGCVIIDEIHLLHDLRGPVLESLVTRIHRLNGQSGLSIRLVGLSATLPNFQDVASFLRVSDRGLFVFDPSFRPVPLETQFVGLKEKRPLRRRELEDLVAYTKVREIAAGDDSRQQVLVFVHSRKETVRVGELIVKRMEEDGSIKRLLPDRETDFSRKVLQSESQSIINQSLAGLIPSGVAIHHAGLSRSDRNTVEDLFSDGHVRVLVSTATLSWGVNLPAYAVIIKSTKVYSADQGKWTELSSLDLGQMLGRAGRPAFDTTGLGIVITEHHNLLLYLSLLNQQLPVESQLLSRLPDVLNAEVVLGFVSNFSQAVEWLNSTYFNVRLGESPTVYEVPSDTSLAQFKENLIDQALTLLDHYLLINYDRQSGAITSTELGRVSAHFYVDFETVKTFNEHLHKDITIMDVFRIFSLAGEFKNIVIRNEEVIELEKLLELCPIPVRDSLTGPTARLAKINVLLQAYISNLPLEGFAVNADMVYIHQSAMRLFRALFSICLFRKWSQASLLLLELAKSIDSKTWSVESPLRQFKAIPDGILSRLEQGGVPFEHFLQLEESQLAELVRGARIKDQRIGSDYEVGRKLLQYIRYIPRLKIEASVQPITRGSIKIDLSLIADFDWSDDIHSRSEPFWIFVTDSDEELVVHSEFYILSKRFSNDESLFSFRVPLIEPLSPHYFVHLISDRWLGSKTTLTLSFRSLLLPSKFNPLIEELPLEKLPTSMVKMSVENTNLNQYRELIGDFFSFSSFNAIQSQCFDSVFNTNNSVFVSAPSGSGKSVLAELSIFKEMVNNDKFGSIKIICLMNSEEVFDRVECWSQKFKNFGLSVGCLTGDVITDSFVNVNILISTPQNYQSFSSKWKRRSDYSNIGLIIFDGLDYLLNYDHNTEIIINNIKLLLKTKPRIIALSDCTANGTEIAHWLGIFDTKTHQCVFPYSQGARIPDLSVSMVTFDELFPNIRVLAMFRPCFLSICRDFKEFGSGKTVVFVPSSKLAEHCARALLTFASTAHKPDLFQQKSMDGSIIELVNTDLTRLVGSGVAFYHENLTMSDKKGIQSLFNSNQLGLLVVSVEESFVASSKFNSKYVYILDTVKFDGRARRFIDYSNQNLSKMMGTAGSQESSSDLTAKLYIYCLRSKKDQLEMFNLESSPPIESNLDQSLTDYLNYQLIGKVVENREESIKILEPSLLLARLLKNPNYYGLTDTSEESVSDFLSELIDESLETLSESSFIAQKEDKLIPINNSVIASYYCTFVSTIQSFSTILTSSSRVFACLEALGASEEVSRVVVRHEEDENLRELNSKIPFPQKGSLTDGTSKILVLLQARMFRIELEPVLQQDLNLIFPILINLVHCMVDFLASSGWLIPSLAAMEISKFACQRIFIDQNNPTSPLLQIPFFSQERIDLLLEHYHCTNQLIIKGIEIDSPLVIGDLEDEDRSILFDGFNDSELAVIAEFCNSFPSIEVECAESLQVKSSTQSSFKVTLFRESPQLFTNVLGDLPYKKVENWWLLLGNRETNTVYAIKRVAFQESIDVELKFIAPSNKGHFNWSLFVVSDSYIGCDQEVDIGVVVE
ncbi:hypothetical protein P9112_005899 [Eukaryota sp. TZLM1-RC]